MRSGTEEPVLGSRIAVTLTADRIFGRNLTLSECIQILQQFDLRSAIPRLVLLLHINDRVFMDPDTGKDSRERQLDAFMRFMFDGKPRAAAVAEKAHAGESFRPLSDQALLATLELALQFCRRGGGRQFDNERECALLSHVILSFQSQLFSESFSERLRSLGDLNKMDEQGLGQFVRNRAAHATRSYYRHAMGRLFGICCTNEIGNVLYQKMHVSLDDWFRAHFGVLPQAYVSLAFMLVTPALRLNLEIPRADDLFFDTRHFFGSLSEPHRSQAEFFAQLSTCSVNDFPPKTTLPPIEDYLYNATAFYVRPILNTAGGSCCVSPTLLLNKFLTGLPYLAQEARTVLLKRPLTNSEIKAARAPFGHLYEAYVIWLFRHWLSTWSRTEVIAPYYCRTQTNKNAERDLVIVRRDAAFAFEIKSAPPLLDLRRTGLFVRIDSMVKEGARQVREAAEALLLGKAFRPDGTAITGVRRVIPCVVTYDTLPLFPIISGLYEDHLERELDVHLFRQENGIYPLQFLDALFIEAWESHFDLSPECGSPFGYLETRARDPIRRHMEIDDSMIVGGARPEAPRPFNDLVEAAFKLVQTEARSCLRPNQG